MKTIALFGGTGRVGSAVLGEALARGYKVRALVRSLSELEPVENLEIIEGDATVQADVDKLVAGSDITITALAPRNINSSAGLFHITTQNIIKANSKRLLVVSNMATIFPGDKRTLIFRLITFVFNKVFPSLSKDKALEAQALINSNTDWLVARLSLVRLSPSERPYRSNPKTPVGFFTHSNQAANFLLDNAGSHESGAVFLS